MSRAPPSSRPPSAVAAAYPTEATLVVASSRAPWLRAPAWRRESSGDSASSSASNGRLMHRPTSATAVAAGRGDAMRTPGAMATTWEAGAFTSAGVTLGFRSGGEAQAPPSLPLPSSSAGNIDISRVGGGVSLPPPVGESARAVVAAPPPSVGPRRVLSIDWVAPWASWTM